MVMPEGSTLTYEYLSTNSLHDADASRVTRVKVATTAVATYAYNGVGQLVGTSLPQPDVFMTLYDPADLDDYDRLDNFGRVTQCKWTRDLATDKDFYHTTVTWDRNGNVTLIEDQIHSGLDVSYTNDNVNRLTKAEEGTWNGSSITSRTREQNWTLSPNRAASGSRRVAHRSTEAQSGYVGLDPFGGNPTSSANRSRPACNHLSISDFQKRQQPPALCPGM